MVLALWPNLNVLSVSLSLYTEGEPVIIRHVLLFPPSDSESIRVNLDSLYGMCDLFLEVSALMTFPRTVKLRFIFLASSSVFPEASVLLIFSEPAKSTRNSFPTLHDMSSELF